MAARATPDDLSIAAATPILRDHRWLELTSAANQAFRDGAAARARRPYGRTPDEAERLFATLDPADTAVPLPAIVSIACHNLAQLAAQAGGGSGCGRLLVLAFDRLAGAARQPATPLALRIACIQHLKYTITELVEHLTRQTAPDPPLAHYIGRMREGVATVNRAAAHMERAGDGVIQAADLLRKVKAAQYAGDNPGQMAGGRKDPRPLAPSRELVGRI